MIETQGVLRGVPVTLDDIAAQDAAALMQRNATRSRRGKANTHRNAKARGKRVVRKNRGAW